MGKREALQVFGGKLDLPTLPDVVLRINALIDNPASGVQEMGRLAAQDPAIMARVLRLANSGYYGLREQVTSPEHAATVIGARALRNVAMQVSILQRYEHLRDAADFDVDDLWSHSLLTAQLAQGLAQHCHRSFGLDSDDFYACGLLHDVGKVVLLEGLGDQYVECIRHARRTGSTLHVAEEHVLGFTHVEVGALLAQQWQLPDNVAKAIEFHHGPTSEVVANPHIGVVAIADQVAYRAGSATFDGAIARLAALAERLLGVTRADFDALIEPARAAEVRGLG